MADVKISNLPEVQSLSTTDVAPFVSSGVTSKITLQNIAATMPQVSSSISASYAVTASYVLNGGGHIIQDSGSSLTQRTKLNFVRMTVSDDVTNNATVVTRPPSTTVSSTAPINPEQGDEWIDSDTWKKYVWYLNSGGTSYWVETGVVVPINGTSGTSGIGAFPYVGAAEISGSLTITGSLTVSGSNTLTNIGPANFIGDNTITGSLNISGSQNNTGLVNITGPLILSGGLLLTGSINVSASNFSIYGSGSANPLFSVYGSLGQMLSVYDELTGSLWSINDATGLPVFEARGDSRIFMGSYQSPILMTSVKTTLAAISNNIVYERIPSANYNLIYYDYLITSTSNYRAGEVFAFWNGTTVTTTDTVRVNVGTTTGVVFSVTASSENLILSASANTDGWVTKVMIRAI